MPNLAFWGCAGIALGKWEGRVEMPWVNLEVRASVIYLTKRGVRALVLQRFLAILGQKNGYCACRTQFNLLQNAIRAQYLAPGLIKPVRKVVQFRRFLARFSFAKKRGICGVYFSSMPGISIF